MKLVALIALACIPSGVGASPIYLKCQLDQDVGRKPAWDVSLNEETGTVAYYFPDIDRAFTVRGVFTVDRVTFNGFAIDRTNFEFERDMTALQAPGRPPVIDKGRCTLAVTKRAF